MQLPPMSPAITPPSVRSKPKFGENTPKSVELAGDSVVNASQRALSRKIEERLARERGESLDDFLNLKLPSGLTGQIVLEVLYAQDVQARERYDKDLAEYNERIERHTEYKTLPLMERLKQHAPGNTRPKRPGKKPDLSQYRYEYGAVRRHTIYRTAGITESQSDDLKTLLSKLVNMNWSHYDQYGDHHYYIPVDEFDKVAKALAKIYQTEKKIPCFKEKGKNGHDIYPQRFQSRYSRRC